MADEVLTERRGRTLIITINRPEARNAINSAVSHALAAAVEELDADDDLSLAVLTGAGGKLLCRYGSEGIRGRRERTRAGTRSRIHGRAAA